MKVHLFLFLLFLCGCARVNRWDGNFRGTARAGTFENNAGIREPGVLFSIQQADDIKRIGKDNKSLPLTNITVVLTTRRSRLIPPEKVPLEREIWVKGILDTTSVKSGTGKDLVRQKGTSPEDFQPVLRAKKIRQTQ